MPWWANALFLLIGCCSSLGLCATLCAIEETNRFVDNATLVEWRHCIVAQRRTLILVAPSTTDSPGAVVRFHNVTFADPSASLEITTPNSADTPSRVAEITLEDVSFAERGTISISRIVLRSHAPGLIVSRTVNISALTLVGVTTDAGSGGVAVSRSHAVYMTCTVTL